MAKSKKRSNTLIRSDKNLLALGLFAAALLIAVVILFDSRPSVSPSQAAEVQNERTYRVETAPAAIGAEEESMSPDEEQATPEDMSVHQMDY
jgi:hypothetical protein